MPSPPTDTAKSKSERKREALAVRRLAAELVGLADAQLVRIPLDEDVTAAVREARRIGSNIARKRQLQYIARLLRRGEVTPVVEAMDGLRAEARQLTARHRRAEAWRDRLIESGDQALSELIAARPDLDAQALRQAMRNAIRERQQQRSPGAARALFRLLHDLDRTEPLPAP